MADGGSGQGIGARGLRKEDKRFLEGAGRYVSDIALPRTLEAAIVRSPVAHAVNLKVSKPAGADRRVFTADDMAVDGVKPIQTRAAAEDLVAETAIDFDALPPAVDMIAAADASAPKVHDDWDDNIVLDSRFEANADDISAPVSVTRTFRMNRQAEPARRGGGACRMGCA